ncbi:Uncharacterised protein [Serratia fonticola]|uniref:Uncharacterized protein n=1 Tax=Serratia fonticola TaxID=47917 RepID=A0A4U9UVM5_SERFO|nr:Uncharacterised protein [Serratia fonticola]
MEMAEGVAEGGHLLYTATLQAALLQPEFQIDPRAKLREAE